jgi:hypothetical protein
MGMPAPNAPPPGAMSAAAPAAAPAAARPAAAAPAATSMTNNQTAGVDEADFVKNDGGYLYAALNGALRIVDVWPPEQAHSVAQVTLPGVPRKLLVNGDRALVYLSIPANTAGAAASSGRAPRVECSYGYDCMFGGDGTDTALLIYDISDRAAPSLLRRLDLDGSLIAARRIGDAVHTVVVTPDVILPGLMAPAVSISACTPEFEREQALARLEAQRAYNTQLIEQSPLPSLALAIREGEQEYSDSSCNSLYRETTLAGMALTSLVSLDLQADEPPTVATIISKAGVVYASEAALYMAVIAPPPNAAAGPVPGAPASSPGFAPAVALTTDAYSSVIHKFRIGDDVESTAYEASGSVKGHVLNQFSLDEYAGHLRVATTSGRVPMPDVHSTLSVLEQRDGELRIAGSVDQIAPSEDIRSVRFEGDNGFVVTFKKTDPLYVFDLSEPSAPRIAGELKIPGFSTYMHMLDESHLLTIGFDADDQGSFAFFDGVLLQIFDVSDPHQPTLAHKVVIGTRGSSSAALTNHLAFTLFQDKLAVPMTVCEGGGDGSFGTNLTFSGLIVYDVGVESGIQERGRVAHPDPNTGAYVANCGNWWTQASSTVQRSMFMDDFVYSIAPDVMRVQDLNSLGTDLATVRFTP